MTKMDMIQCLAADAAAEVEKIEKYREAAARADRSVLHLERPSRQRIKDDLKMVRRLSLEVEKEAEQLW